MAQTPPFLALPGEIRNQIVSYAFHRAPGSIPASSLSKSAVALAWTCRQLYAEYASLARSHSAIYPLKWLSAQHLAEKTQTLLTTTCAAQITKLQILLPACLGELYVCDLSATSRRRVKGFHFAAAGLPNLEELYFRFQSPDSPGNGDGRGSGGAGRELVVHMLWRLLWEKDLSRLNKICIVHDGAQPFLSLTLLHGMLVTFKPLYVSRRWHVKSDFEHGRLVFVEKSGSKTKRRIAVLVGYSFREAEEYVSVCEDIIEDKHADIVIARRRDCKYVAPLEEVTDAQLRQEVDNLHTLFPVSATEEPLLQPHLERIRARCHLSR
ncbi:hypothetical protein COCVIDRAFT_95166 [Bipolaris victoriae FI3]|uniref:F-box domain-containing protein n=1 Tax=Bipolaris victoriae (strain FI3) TaxID=930091 RepID=W7ER69_BIPV3|nr:hypothetical protein COCVIDRAFT_95166 [Bipolaris victoriae FI3]